MPTTTQVAGWPVVVEPGLPSADHDALLARLGRIFALIESALPGHLAGIRPHVSTLQVIRFPCRGAFVQPERALIVERTFLADPARHDAEIAATILHEGEHARLRGLGEAEAMTLADEERSCRRVEIAFGQLVEGGEVVVARATEALLLADQDVAPDVDWQVAWERTDGG